MRFRQFSHSLAVMATVVVLVSLMGLVWALHSQPRSTAANLPILAQARRPAGQALPNGTIPPPQVVVGEPEEYDVPSEPARYTYRNDFPEDRSKPLSLYLIDTQTGQETRLGDDTDAAFFGTMDKKLLLWYFQGLHVYTLATDGDKLISREVESSIHPKISGDWAAFGRYGPERLHATLFAANLQSHELITLTHELNAQDGGIDGYFGLSPRLVAWYTFSYPDPSAIVIYDLTTRTEITRLTNLSAAFNEGNLVIYDLSLGETVVTWSNQFGYDLITHSYFRIPTVLPPDWDHQPIADVNPLPEHNRIVSWVLQMKDGSQRYTRARLLDATPSATPCVEGQNLVQNGDLEDVAHHTIWQQSGNQSNLLVNDPPPGASGGGQWAIRLGRYRNAQQAIRQTLAIPSGVKSMTLHFDVQVGTWDPWGGDWLEVDLIDPATNQSILVTPLRWRNTQLASPDWLPISVEIQNWPGIDIPLYLEFRGITDWAIPTDFSVDNVRLVTTCQ